MSHQVIIPPTDTGGGSLTAHGSRALVRIEWVPAHDLTPEQERRRIDRAERMRLKIEAMLNAPTGEEAPDE